jgi:zinc protease
MPRHVARLLFPTLACAALFAMSCTTSREQGAVGGRQPPQEPWRSLRPPAGPAPQMKLPAFQRAELKNGLTIYVVEDDSLPMIEVAVIVRAGSAHEAAREAGLAALTWELLDEGAGSMNTLALANAFGAIGARVKTSMRSEWGMARTTLLKTHADAGLDLLATVVRRPMFAQSDFDRVRAQLLGELKAREGAPAAIATALGHALTYGVDHPYGHDERGTVPTLERLTAARVKRFWADHAGPRNAALVLAGDITLEEAKALAEKHFGKWSGGPKAAKPPSDPKPRGGFKIALVDIPGSPQTTLRMERPLLAYGDPEEAAFLVFNEIFGGTFSSRLNLKLREEKGWTYGAGSFADRRSGKGPFVIATDVQTLSTADAVVEVLNEIDAFQKTGATDDEIARAKEGWVKSLPSLIGLPEVQVTSAATLFAHGLAPDYFDKLVEGVNAVDAEAVKKIAARALVRDELVLVLVGDQEQIEPKLKEKALGEISSFNRDGSEVRAP